MKPDITEKQEKTKKINKISRINGGYDINVGEKGNTYHVIINDTEMTDLEYTKELIRNRINMLKKHEENISKLMEIVV